MHELYLTAFIGDEELEQARSVLQGYCAMTAPHTIHHVVYFAGPSRPRGLPNMRPFYEEQKMDKQQVRPWSELAQILSRQSYIMQARYPVSMERHVGPDAEVMDPFAKGAVGNLRWADIPDPTSKDAVMVSKAVEIANQKDLANILKSNFQEYKSSALEESYIYYNDGFEFSLVRHRTIPPETTTAPPKTLPAWDATQTVDPSGSWTVRVRAVVVEDATPDAVRAAHDALLAVQTQLHGVLDFLVLDRRVHDTRVAPKISSTPIPLPQNLAAAAAAAAAARAGGRV